MEHEAGYRLSRPSLQFSSDKTVIEKGQSVTLQWSAPECEEVVFWKTALVPTAPELLDWWAIYRLGERTKASGTLEVSPEKSTAYFLVGRSPKGLVGQRIVIGTKSSPPGAEPLACSATGVMSGRMQRLPQEWVVQRVRPVRSFLVAQIETALRIGELWESPADQPYIQLSASSPVIFEDETAVLSWNISNANYADSGDYLTRTFLLPDPYQPSGSKYDGGDLSLGATCGGALPLNGSRTLDGPTEKAQCLRVNVTATNLLGKVASSAQWVDILSVPQFAGVASAARVSFVRATLKEIDQKLRSGCIINDTPLDSTVPAFKAGHLSRAEVWSRLVAELQNMGLTTFLLQDLKGTSQAIQDAASASWASYAKGNQITLCWKVDLNLMPTPYAIMHELVHKCGFHDALLQYYDRFQIEEQTDTVASACYP